MSPVQTERADAASVPVWDLIAKYQDRKMGPLQLSFPPSPNRRQHAKGKDYYCCRFGHADGVNRDIVDEDIAFNSEPLFIRIGPNRYIVSGIVPAVFDYII